MYRKLIWLPLLAFAGLTAAVALVWAAPGPDQGWLHAPVAGLVGRLWPEGALVSGTWRLALAFFAGGLLPLLAGALLNWGAAFYPGRRPGAPLRVVKYLAMGLGLAAAALLIVDRAVWAGGRALILAGQSPRPLPLVLVASQVPYGLLEMAALSLMLAGPFFWLIRGTQVRSLQRASFEAWVESRRLILPGVALLGVGAVLEAVAGPSLLAWFLR